MALVILVDLATGQGPPIYNNYLAAQNYRPPPPLPAVPIGYGPPPQEYEVKQVSDGEYEKAADESKFEDKKDKKEFEKETKKDSETGSTGVLSSFSNTMSDAWKSLSTLGRRSRSVDTDTDTDTIVIGDDNSKPNNERKSSAAPSPSKARGIDDNEYLQNNNQGYIYFKVPRNLVCHY